jgi:hypothetical protein
MSSIVTDQAVAELAALHEELLDKVGKPNQWFDPGYTLNYADRRGSEVRMFKYLQQMCLGHHCNFVSGNHIKQLYLIDGFVAMASAQNPLALYALARSMFELSAFLHEVQKRLQEVTLQINENTWQPLGEKYFGLIVRARFATTHPKFRQQLLSDGMPESRLKPFNIMHCIQELATEPEHQDAIARYELLCDYVHHNLSSMTMANSGSMISDVAQSARGGMMFASHQMPITQYEYPVHGKADRALNDLAPEFLRDTRAGINWLNKTPESPFPTEMILRKTGSLFGIPMLRPPSL